MTAPNLERPPSPEFYGRPSKRTPLGDITEGVLHFEREWGRSTPFFQPDSSLKVTKVWNKKETESFLSPEWRTLFTSLSKTDSPPFSCSLTDISEEDGCSSEDELPDIAALTLEKEEGSVKRPTRRRLLASSETPIKHKVYSRFTIPAKTMPIGCHREERKESSSTSTATSRVEGGGLRREDEGICSLLPDLTVLTLEEGDGLVERSPNYLLAASTQTSTTQQSRSPFTTPVQTGPIGLHREEREDTFITPTTTPKVRGGKVRRRVDPDSSVRMSARTRLIPVVPPLFTAAQEGDISRLESLLKTEDPNQRDQLGETALVHAFNAGQLEAAGFLMKNGVEIDAALDLDWIPRAAFLCCKKGELALLREIVKDIDGEKIASWKQEGYPLLSAAIDSDRLDIMEFLVNEKGVGKNQIYPGALENPSSALGYAAFRKNKAFVKLLLGPSDKNRTSIMQAVLSKSVTALEFLLSDEEEIQTLDDQDSEGMTAMGLALDSENLEMVELLRHAFTKKREKERPPLPPVYPPQGVSWGRFIRGL